MTGPVDTDLDIVAVEGPVSFWDDPADLLAGLAEPTPRVPPRFGYDERGSRLFEQITELPTYYLTRVERELLTRHADHMAEAMDTAHLVELGSGSAKKTGLLIAACLRRGPLGYYPVDVSREMLAESILELRALGRGLRMQGLWGRYEAGLERLRTAERPPVTVAFLGSSLGNTTVAERRALLDRIGACTRPGDGVLLSVDLRKSADALDTCYNDPPGATAFAEFRRNHLIHLNRRFAGDFRPEQFEPRAHYVPERGEVEAHLYATRNQRATLGTLGLTLSLDGGESINVGISAKFDRDDLLHQLAAAGLSLVAEWTAPRYEYSVLLLRRVETAPENQEPPALDHLAAGVTGAGSLITSVKSIHRPVPVPTRSDSRQRGSLREKEASSCWTTFS